MGLDKVKLEVPWEFERDRSALIVIDMQNDFVREGAIMEVPEAAVCKRILSLVSKPTGSGITVLCPD
ncbi:MAG TPA: hypothetical protein DCD97_05545 [Firmicutes bacterium]|jgi:nicotinamidase-related amidase|nr:hypothetical protein [Bacillota bacterium]